MASHGNARTICAGWEVRNSSSERAWRAQIVRSLQPSATRVIESWGVAWRPRVRESSVYGGGAGDWIPSRMQRYELTTPGLSNLGQDLQFGGHVKRTALSHQNSRSCRT